MALLLGDVDEEICVSSTLGSSSSGETLDPTVGSGGDGVFNVEDLGFIGASCRLDGHDIASGLSIGQGAG